ncbi:MAG: hypothetical protein JW862_11050 [Anaerolineales bacterium]|nr:hypothetical protein [Anaerolineales bacterium]
MRSLLAIEPIDYLVIGHLACDLTPSGQRLGGTAAYAGLTAQALGLRVGIVSAWGQDTALTSLDGIALRGLEVAQCTRFENIHTGQGRVQYVRQVAENLDYYLVPESWRTAPLVHLAPIAQEVEPGLVRRFPQAFLGLTPQGWLREWDLQGQVRPAEWPEASFILANAGATVLSIEDLAYDEDRIAELSTASQVLVITEGALGARVYWHGDVRRIRAPEVEEVDATGAGDIFAAAFFVRLQQTRDPWEATRFANQIAANSVTRPGLAGVPLPQEIEKATVEVL